MPTLVAELRTRIFQQSLIVLGKVVFQQVQESSIVFLRDSRILDNKRAVLYQRFCRAIKTFVLSACGYIRKVAEVPSRLALSVAGRTVQVCIEVDNR